MAPATTENSNARTYVDGEYLVQFKDDSGLETEDQLREKAKAIGGDALSPAGLYSCLRAIYVELTPSQIAMFEEDPSVETVEQVSLYGIPQESPQPVQLLTQTPSTGAVRLGVGSPGVTHDGTGKRVWVIDSGIQMDHPDLNVNQTLSKSFVPGFPTPDDQTGHGTRVAGIIGAKNNTIGTIGMAHDADLISLKVDDDVSGGIPSNVVVAALNHLCQFGRPGEVVNMSIGQELDPLNMGENLIEVHVKRLANKGMLICIAAGQKTLGCTDPNALTCGVDANTFSPARVNHPNVYTVSGFRDDNDTYMRISNWGIPPIDYCAPGRKINTTNINSGYAEFSGTSAATPHLSGILLVRAQNSIPSGGTIYDHQGTPYPVPHL